MQSAKTALIILWALGVFALVGMGMILGRSVDPSTPLRVFAWALGSILFGVLVGLSEILSRYRDEPLRASTTDYGLAYLLLNGVVSLAAFLIMRRYADLVFPAVKNDLLLTTVVAGFGGMTLLRSKLFTFRSPDGKEYSIGPAIVLETAFKTLDRKIDRVRASSRQAAVSKAMKDVTDFPKAADYIEASLLSFQNLSQEDKAQVAAVIEQYRKESKWPDALKILGLGFAFLTLAGEENFSQVVSSLKLYLNPSTTPAATAAPTPPVTTGPTVPPPAF